jgi:hypothetical protein
MEGRLMASSLPTESALDKTVETFGLGAYDYPQSGFEHGEDSNQKKNEKALPDDGGPLDPFGPDRLLSYPTNMASAMMPGDIDRPPSQKTPPPSHLDSVVHSVSQAKLPPSDSSVTRSDYYDALNTASLVRSLDDMFSNSGDDSYVSSESEETLPVPPSNYEFFDNNTQALGNYWSGSVIQDQSVPAGFPSTEFEDPSRWQKTNASEKQMMKTATNVDLVKSLTADFIKQYGKKDLTRRHIMAFLQKQNSHQYLASDIVRCLAHEHDIVVKDVLDQFPVYKKASSNHLSSIRSTLIELEIQNMTKPEVSSVFRMAAADLSRTIALLERLGVSNG